MYMAQKIGVWNQPCWWRALKPPWNRPWNQLLETGYETRFETGLETKASNSEQLESCMWNLTQTLHATYIWMLWDTPLLWNRPTWLWNRFETGLKPKHTDFFTGPWFSCMETDYWFSSAEINSPVQKWIPKYRNGFSNTEIDSSVQEFILQYRNSYLQCRDWFCGTEIDSPV